MNVKDSIKKVGAVAASTLMVGMTMGAAQSLGEFPGMFVDDDGTPTAQVVVGSQGAVSDVVGAVNVAAALGQATLQTEETTETVDVETAGSVGWSASDGQTLDTQNDNLFFGQAVDTVRQTLTDEHLDTLETVTFQDDDGNSQDVEHYLYVGDESIGFGQPGDTGDDDPFLYVNNPANPGALGDGLYKLQANFGDGLDITETAADGGNDAVLGEDIELFGKSFTISEDSFSTNNAGELVLFGSSEEYDLETGESTTFEVNGEEHELEVRAVTDSNTAAFYIDGELRQRDEGQSFNVDGTDVRLSTVIQTSTQNSEGLVTFSIGSEEYVLSDGNPVEDGDGEDIDGTYVEFSGDYTGDVDNDMIDISSIEIEVGAADSDDSFVAAGDSFEDPLFEGIQFHFGGLAPDAGEGAGDSVSEVAFETDGDDTVTAGFSDGDNDASVQWAYATDPGNSNNVNLADEDDDSIVVVEGAAVTEDDYVAVDAGGFSHLFEVRDIDPDNTGDNIADGDELEISLSDQVSGSSTEVDLDAYDGGDGFNNGDTNDIYRGEEVIDGQTYHFWTNNAADEFYVTWDSASDFDNTGNQVSVFPALDADGDTALALTDASELVGNLDTTTDDSATDYSETLELPSTESTGSATVDVSVDDTNNAVGDATLNVGSQSVVVGDGNSDQLDVLVGQTSYTVTLDNTGAAGETSVSIAVDGDQDASNNNADTVAPAALTLQPEDDSDEEHGYVHAPGVDQGDAQIDAAGGNADILYTGGTYSPENLESDDDMYVDYNVFGTHSMENRDDQGSFTLHIPNQQAVAGAAFTGSSGELSQGGSSSGQGEVTYTGLVNEDIRGALPDLAKTDDQVTQSDREGSHLILVGGPAVNTLVADLADDGETWTTDEWRNEHQDEALLQVVEDAFSDGQHAMIVAGHSADDTRAAARYVSEWRSHQDALEGQMQYSPSSQEAPR